MLICHIINGMRVALDPVAVTSILENPVPDTKEPTVPTCLVFCGNHPYQIIGSFDNILQAIVEYDPDAPKEHEEPGGLPGS